MLLNVVNVQIHLDKLVKVKPLWNNNNFCDSVRD